MKKRKTINIIGIILIIAVLFFAGVLFPNKARIGYYRQIDDKGKFYDYNRNDEKRVYIFENNKKERMKFLNMYCDDVLIYHFTASRSGFFILSFFLVYVYLMKRVKIINRNSKKLLNIVLIFSILFSFIVAELYGKNQFVNNLNIVLTGRIRYMNETLKNYNLPLFSTNHYVNILFDNGYFDLIYNGGILAFIWFMYNQIKTNKILFKHNVEREIVVTLFLFIYCITESYYASIIMNISLVFLSYFVYSNETYEGNEKNLK